MFPRVRDIIRIYDKSGLTGLKSYFDNKDLIIDPSTWAGHIKKSIDEGLILSTSTEIELLLEKFKFYKNVSEKSSGTGTSRNDGKGNSGTKREIKYTGR